MMRDEQINSLYEIIAEPFAVAVHLRHDEQKRCGAAGGIVFNLSFNQLNDEIRREIDEICRAIEQAISAGDMPPGKVRHFWTRPAPPNHRDVELSIGGNLDSIGEWSRGRIIIPIRSVTMH